MKTQLMIMVLIVIFLSGCGGGGGSDTEHQYITAPNGLSFNLINENVSFEDVINSGDTHLYAIDVLPGYHYNVNLDTITGDSDLYLYYDYHLSSQSLLGYSELNGDSRDTVTFYSDFSGTIYIEVFGSSTSNYLISVDAYQ